MKILLLGSTGSIGTSTINCVSRNPDKFTLTGLAANKRAEQLLQQAQQFDVRHLCIGDIPTAEQIKSEIPSQVSLFTGTEGLVKLVEEVEYDLLVNALVGFVGFAPTVAALKRKKRVALANKESLVVGGDLINNLIDQGFGSLIPIDSEHSAILQALSGEEHDAIESIILTASGGPFRDYEKQDFASITKAQALNHPTWAMGEKITIDSATLMNKGFEVIEAHHIFRLPYDKLRVCIHHQSIIHSMVEFHDGGIIAQMGVPDMELPIQYALSYPHRLPLPGDRLNLAALGQLTFAEPDLDRFPCLRLCLEAGQKGGTAPAAINAANEVAVQLFLEERISYTMIAQIIEEILRIHTVVPVESLEQINHIDTTVRDLVPEITEKISV